MISKNDVWLSVIDHPDCDSCKEQARYQVMINLSTGPMKIGVYCTVCAEKISFSLRESLPSESTKENG